MTEVTRDVGRAVTTTLLLVIIVLLLIIGPFLMVGKSLESWLLAVQAQAQGSPVATALVVVLSLAADVVAPVPSSIVATFSGTTLGLARGAMANWVGMTLGSVIGYGIGSGALSRITRATPNVDARRRQVPKSAILGAIVASRGVPVMAESITLLAGAYRVPFVPFLAVSTLANLGIAAAYAYVGARAASADSVLLALVSALVLPAVALLVYRIVRPPARSDAGH